MKRCIIRIFVLSIIILTSVLGYYIFSPFNISAEIYKNNSFKQIETIIKDLQKKGAKIGFQVVDLDNKKTLWTYNHREPLIPASNVKLLTSAVSFIRLGVTYCFRTGIYISKNLIKGTLVGNIYIKVFGDPFLVISIQSQWCVSIIRLSVDSRGQTSGFFYLDKR